MQLQQQTEHRQQVIAHNGNLTNAIELRHELEYTGAIFQTTIDSEVIAYHIARELQLYIKI